MAEPLFKFHQVKIFFRLTFIFNDCKSVISILNVLYVRISSVLCSDPLLRKETLNGGLGFSLYSANKGNKEICLQINV
jgi:hypothetical protein